MGWYGMAIVDVLDYFPATHPGHSSLLSYLQTFALAISQSQDSSGAWFLVMNEPYPSNTKNYLESSATAMFTYTLLKAIRLGYLPSTTYLPFAEKAYKYMTEKFAVVQSNGPSFSSPSLTPFLFCIRIQKIHNAELKEELRDLS